MSQTDLDRQNVVWKTPSKDASGSMPLGNGEVGINLWVEEGGDLLFYVSRTDAWSEASRLLKLGRVRIKISPNPFELGKPFRQELVLKDGRIRLELEEGSIDIFVDSAQPVIHIQDEWKTPHTMVASLESWRSAERELKGRELASSWTMQDAPIKVIESADIMSQDGDAQVLIHANAPRSLQDVVGFTLNHQSLSQFQNLAPDPITGRLFGLRLEPVRGGYAIAAESKQVGKTAFANLLKNQIQASPPLDARRRTQVWWREFWDRSWIFVEGDAAEILPASRHHLRIGYDSGEGNRFMGAIKDAVVYDRPLSPAEISALPTRQAANPVLSTVNDHARKKLKVKHLEGLAPLGTTYYESEEPSPFDLRRGFTVAARITPQAATARIFDMLTAGQGDGFLFDTYPGHALRAVVGDRTVIVPEMLEAGKSAHVSLTVTPAGGITIAKDGKVVYHAEEEATVSRVTQAYTLQRYMNAIGGRGNFPIKFNGSIFTVEPRFLGEEFNPDWRKWGDCYWWQNTRLPYFAMPAAGDYDLMLPLFRMYESVVPIAKARAASYYGAKGVYFPETMTTFGTYANKDYGWDRTGHKPSEVLCPWWQYAWQQSLELLSLMLDYQASDKNGQQEFEYQRLLPMVRDSMAYFNSRFKADTPFGKMRITPTQAAETYWYDVVNDTPTVAGLRAIKQRVLDLNEKSGKPRNLLKPGENAPLLMAMEFQSLAAPKFPDIPLKDGKVAPAESYKDERSNVENPEFYAIWPFRLYGVGRPNLTIAQKTFRERIEKANSGWQYDGQVAALAGLTEDARDSLLSKVRNSNKAYRWPATWGPNYDWLPDQCHGANIMLTLQTMCLQEVGDKLYVLPAFPREWDVKFKLHASRGTTVEVEYVRGRLIKAIASPKNRQNDLVLP